MHDLLEIALSNALVAIPLAVLAFAVSRATHRPALTHALWLLVLIKLVTPPLFTVSVPWPDGETAAVAQPLDDSPPPLPLDRAEAARAFEELTGVPFAKAEPASVVPPLSSRTEPEPPVDLAGWLVGLWLVGAGVALALALRQIRRFSRFTRSAEPAPQELVRLVRLLCRRLGLRRAPEVQMIPGALSPMLWAPAGKARLLLPTELVRRLDRGQKVALLAHELAHLRRRDHWVRHLELVVRGLYWWNPLVWWVCRELRRAEEECCDAWVIWALPSASRSYADALVETVDFLSRSHSVVPAAASGAGHSQNLKWRLTMIMRGNTKKSLSGASRLAVCAVAAAALSLAPVFGQSATKEMIEIEAKLAKAQQKADALAAELEALEHEQDRQGEAGHADRAEALAKSIASLRAVRDKMRHEEDSLVSRLHKMKAYGVARSLAGGQGHAHDHGDGDDHHDAAIDAIHAGVAALEKVGDLEGAEKLAKVGEELKHRHVSHNTLSRLLHGRRDAAEGQVRRVLEAHEAGKALGRASRDGDDAIVARLHEHLVKNTVEHQDRVDRLEDKVDHLAEMVEKLLHAQHRDGKSHNERKRSGYSR